MSFTSIVTAYEARLSIANLCPGVCFDLWELELLVIRVHLTYLLARRRAQNFDNLDQLVNATVAREDRLTQQ